MKLLDIFVSFTKVGVFAYGGGPSMIPLVQEEVVDVHGWMTIEEFADALAMGYALPGPIAT
ncbi:MAG: chromate transporter, partial [bacterium]|nr:chromate transporter [bacterium]